ncbi:MAG: ATP-dependent DNA helicase RecG [Clostridia bacterium]|nr:ATP-dependent DNA helicase RecG [Clostridia bacterium]
MASLYRMELSQLKGVGAKTAGLFSKLGLQSVGALLRFYPRDYENWSETVPIASAPFGEISIIKAEVASPVETTRLSGGRLMCKTLVTDGETDLILTFFNNRFIPNQLHQGNTYLFRGKIGGTFFRREMVSPQIMREGANIPIRPVYSQTEGLKSNQIARAASQALALLPDPLEDPIPPQIREKYGLCDLRSALFMIHTPNSIAEIETARRRLVFEELLYLQLGIAQLGNESKVRSRYRIGSFEDDFYRLLPFAPTGAQRRSVSEMLADMRSGNAMNRLLQGDVGSGKTAVAAALCYCVAKSGYQSALMAPTEILAGQHYESFLNILRGSGVRTALLTGSVKGKARKELLQKLSEGEIDLLIGTHALLTEDVEFRNLALVITDEQHRFGVTQRLRLQEKGEHPHTLIMSATPIPRTLALMIYGDLALSVLDEMPPGRQKIATYAIGSDKRERAYGYLRKHIDAGYQCYIICPLIEEGESDMASVEEYEQILRESPAFEGVRIGTLHGRMKNDEKNAVMSAFSKGEIDLLVSTTVVEVGVDVPNAVIILIENAERYGLSQLHQLRGRVGRGKAKSTCILVTDAQNEEAAARMKIMCTTNNGFTIAEEDLKLRGPGNFFGNEQHGLPKMKIADLRTNMETLSDVQNCAREILETDPALELHEHRMLRSEIRLLFQKVGGYGIS